MAQFKHACTGCACARAAPPPKPGRSLNVHPHYELLAAARSQAATDAGWHDEDRRWRPHVARAIAWLVARCNRRVPYRGVIANNIWLHHRAAALTLPRLIT
ncbi:transposase [Streptomyces sp. NPDC059718]